MDVIDKYFGYTGEQITNLVGSNIPFSKIREEIEIILQGLLEIENKKERTTKSIGLLRKVALLSNLEKGRIMLALGHIENIETEDTIFVYIERYKSALKYFMKIEKGEKDYIKSVINRGTTKYRIGEYDQAKNLLLKINIINSSEELYGLAQYNLGIITLDQHGFGFGGRKRITHTQDNSPLFYDLDYIKKAQKYFTNIPENSSYWGSGQFCMGVIAEQASINYGAGIENALDFFRNVDESSPMYKEAQRAISEYATLP